MIIFNITELIFHTFKAENTLACGSRFEHAKHITLHVVSRKYFFNISRNSEANASESLENIKEIFTHSRLWIMNKRFEPVTDITIFLLITKNLEEMFLRY